MPNYALDAMRGYAFVDNIHRQNRNDKIQLEDRALQKERYAKQDAYNDKLRAREEKTYNDSMALWEINAAEIESIFGAELAGNPQAVKKVGGLLQDPARTGKIIAAHDEISKYISSGKNPPNELTTELINLIGAEELAARGGDDGLNRTAESVVPSNKEGEVMIGFNVTGKDGKTYQAPMTTGASADPQDNQVQSIPVNRLLEWGNGGAATAKAIALARAKAGDNSFLEAYRTTKKEQADRAIAMEDYQMQRQDGLSDYESKKKIDQRFEERYVGGGKGGKPQALKTQFNDDGSVSVYDPNTDKLKVVRTEEQKKELSVQMAEQWAEDQAEGVLNPRPKDELIQAKQKEFYNQLNGGTGSLEPMVTVTQNGQTFQVPASSVQQPAPTQPAPTPTPKPKPKPTQKQKPVQENPAKKGLSPVQTENPTDILSSLPPKTRNTLMSLAERYKSTTETNLTVEEIAAEMYKKQMANKGKTGVHEALEGQYNALDNRFKSLRSGHSTSPWSR